MSGTYSIPGTGVKVDPSNPGSLPKKYGLAFVAILSGIALIAAGQRAWNWIAASTPGDQTVEVV